MKRILPTLLVLLGGCSLLVAKPQIAVKSVSVTGLDSKGAEMVFLLAAANPNPYAIRLTGYEYTLIVSDYPLAKGENRDRVEFKRNSTTEVKLPVTVAFRDILEVLKRNPDLQHVPYHITAVFALKTPLGAFKVPVDKSGSLALPLKGGAGRFLRLFR